MIRLKHSYSWVRFGVVLGPRGPPSDRALMITVCLSVSSVVWLNLEGSSSHHPPDALYHKQVLHVYCLYRKWTFPCLDQQEVMSHCV